MPDKSNTSLVRHNGQNIPLSCLSGEKKGKTRKGSLPDDIRQHAAIPVPKKTE